MDKGSLLSLINLLKCFIDALQKKYDINPHYTQVKICITFHFHSLFKYTMCVTLSLAYKLNYTQQYIHWEKSS